MSECFRRRNAALAVALLLAAARLGAAQSVEEDEADSLRAGQALPETARKPELDRVATLIVEQTNQFRREQGREAVQRQERLAATAQYFADYMARTDRYGHTADGNRPAQRAKEHGYDYCMISENIAYQYSTEGFATEDLAGRLVEGWKESPGHRKNMLEEAVTQTGVAVARSDQSGAYYAVQMFGRPASLRLEFSVENQSDKTVAYQLGDKKFDLPPRYTRTHQRCRPASLRFKLPGEEEGPAFKPSSGTALVVQDASGGGVTVEKRAAAKIPSPPQE